jgi:hypothetical protein
MMWLSLVALTLLSAARVDAKAVMAHFMLANSYSYTSAEWKADIQAAQDAHIDAFAINMAYNPNTVLVSDSPRG